MKKQNEEYINRLCNNEIQEKMRLFNTFLITPHCRFSKNIKNISVL